MSGKAWSLLAVAGVRQYAGNEGYSDDPARLYRYDSTVGNSRHVAVGDLAIVRDTMGLIGVGLISKVTSGPGLKQRFRCSVCGTTSIKKRRAKSPAYRCVGGHEFESPEIETIEVTQYEADYGTTWMPVPGAMNAAALRAVTPGEGTQNSIREVDAVTFAGRMAGLRPETHELLALFLQGSVPEALDDTKDEPDAYVPSFEDRRVKILRAIRARKGQARFRNGLIDRYGPRCMMSGCTIMEIVEAAHIWPYRGAEDNALSNGLLLRSDIHTLYDYDLIGIIPASRTIRIASKLAGTLYGALDGRIIEAGGHEPNAEAMDRRWAAFLKTQGLTS